MSNQTHQSNATAILYYALLCHAMAAYKGLPGRFADSIIGHLPKESDSDEESAEVEDKWTDDNYHVAINAVNY